MSKKNIQRNDVEQTRHASDLAPGKAVQPPTAHAAFDVTLNFGVVLKS